MEEEQLYQVQKILRKRKRGGITEYLSSSFGRDGYDSEDDSWITRKNFSADSTLVDEFESAYSNYERDMLNDSDTPRKKRSMTEKDGSIRQTQYSGKQLPPSFRPKESGATVSADALNMQELQWLEMLNGVKYALGQHVFSSYNPDLPYTLPSGKIPLTLDIVERRIRGHHYGTLKSLQEDVLLVQETSNYLFQRCTIFAAPLAPVIEAPVVVPPPAFVEYSSMDLRSEPYAGGESNGLVDQELLRMEAERNAQAPVIQIVTATVVEAKEIKQEKLDTHRAEEAERRRTEGKGNLEYAPTTVQQHQRKDATLPMTIGQIAVLVDGPGFDPEIELVTRWVKHLTRIQELRVIKQETGGIRIHTPNAKAAVLVQKHLDNSRYGKHTVLKAVLFEEQ